MILKIRYNLQSLNKYYYTTIHILNACFEFNLSRQNTSHPIFILQLQIADCMNLCYCGQAYPDSFLIS